MRTRVLVATACFFAALAGCASSTQSVGGAESDGAVVHDLAHKDMAVDVDLAEVALDLSQPADLAQVGGCNPAAEVIGAANGPDTCQYGEVCASTMACVEAPTATCLMAGGSPAWNRAAEAAPVITSVSAVLLPTTATTECANGDPAALVTVNYYSPTTLTTHDSNNAFLAQVKFKKSTSVTGSFFSANFVRVLPPKNQQFGSFQVGINCGGATGVKEAGLYIMDESSRVSNTVCVSW